MITTVQAKVSSAAAPKVEPPNILLVEAPDINVPYVSALVQALQGRGYNVRHLQSADEASSYIARNNKIDFAVIGGSLGDTSFDRHSVSGRLIQDLIDRQIPFGRFTPDRAKITDETLTGVNAYADLAMAIRMVMVKTPLQIANGQTYTASIPPAHATPPTFPEVSPLDAATWSRAEIKSK